MTARRAFALVAMLASPWVAAAEGSAGATLAGAPGAPAALTVAPDYARKGWALEGGWGYYETLHLGVACYVTESAAFDLFGGVGAFEAATFGVGLGFRQAIGKPIFGMDWGWDLKALYWTRSDPNYDWTIVTLIGGAFLSRDLDRHFTVKVDGGVAMSAGLVSDRKQDQTFGHPQRWNASVCLDVVYRFGK